MGLSRWWWCIIVSLNSTCTRKKICFFRTNEKLLFQSMVPWQIYSVSQDTVLTSELHVLQIFCHPVVSCRFHSHSFAPINRIKLESRAKVMWSKCRKTGGFRSYISDSNIQHQLLWHECEMKTYVFVLFSIIWLQMWLQCKWGHVMVVRLLGSKEGLNH